MKGFLTLTLLCLVASPVYANGGLSPEKQEIKERQKMKRGTAGVDETYVEEIKHKESALKKEEKTRMKMQENPRNPAFSESFGQLHSKEDQQSQEEREAVRKQKSREGEAGGEKTEGTVWELEKGRE